MVSLIMTSLRVSTETLNINNAFSFPLSDGSGLGQVLRTNGTGNLSWTDDIVQNTIIQDSNDNDTIRFNVEESNDEDVIRFDDCRVGIGSASPSQPLSMPCRG